MDLQSRARVFRQLHVPGAPLVLFNVWDAGSARVVAEAGAKALATGSWSVAAAQGYEDGECLPLESTLAVVRRIAEASDLPVTVDLEAGYADTAKGVGRTVEAALDAGAVGCNLEDSVPPSGELRSAADQVARLGAARRAADARGVPFFINARTDVFLHAPADAERTALIEQVIERAAAYAEAGADGLFVPGLTEADVIEAVVQRIALPLNVMRVEHATSIDALASARVARISHGPWPYRLAMEALRAAAAQALQSQHMAVRLSQAGSGR